MVKPISGSPAKVDQDVVRKWGKIIEGFQDKAFIKPSKKAPFAQMLENEMKHLPQALKENTSSAAFMNSTGASALGSVPFYIGVIRRGYPKLVGMNLFGVQPLSQPGGALFAVKRTLKGKTNAYSAFANINTFNSRVLVLNTTLTIAENEAITIKDNTGANTIATGNLVYGEDNITVLVYLTSFNSGYSIADVVGGGTSAGVRIYNSAGAHAFASTVYENFANFTYVFKNYSKFRDANLALNNSEFDGNTIRDVGGDVINTPITNIMNRKIRSKVSQEIIEDMNAYKYDIQNDLMNIMLEDITSEMNREFYGYLKTGAENVYPNVAFGSLTGTTDFDKYIQIIAKTTQMSNKIAVDLKTSVGNYMVVSPTILSVFTSLSKYWNYTNDPSVGNINLTQNGNFGTEPYVGKFNNMWDMYIDIFDDNDTILVGNYSENNMDNAWFYLPYIPLIPDILKDPVTAQWVLHYRTRYAVLENPFGAYRWTKKMNITGLTI